MSTNQNQAGGDISQTAEAPQQTDQDLVDALLQECHEGISQVEMGREPEAYIEEAQVEALGRLVEATRNEDLKNVFSTARDNMESSFADPFLQFRYIAANLWRVAPAAAEVK